ncbi:DUF456 family protein [Luteolibacter sp. AS25]|uniref:DUF456 family protein n=1 Tax=Luteolibacter sp. AS25 TaxID=3135776 RepID=UPI00398ACE2C
MELLQGGGVWLVTVSLMLLGLVGCVAPVLPGHLLIFCGALGYRLMKGAEGGIAWWGIGILFALMAISQVFEIASGSLGSKWFGGTKWGAVGALVGGIVGLFFLPFGLLLGPLAGAFGLELAFGKRKTREAVVSGVGSVVGTVSGMVFKLVAGALMIIWFFVDVWAVG